MNVLTDADSPSFYEINENSDKPYLLVCEHAGNKVPKALGDLGLSQQELNQHYAVDIGAEDMALSLSNSLGAPAVVANYSRLVIDLNRRATHEAAFPAMGEGKPIPGNVDMADEERQARIDEIYMPFHKHVKSWIDAKIAQNIVPAIITIHSYTPVFFGQKRPWEVAALWRQDERMPRPFINYFKDKGYVVGDNQPYDARILGGGTMELHGDGRKIPNLLVEYRNDLLLDKDSFKRLLEDTIAAVQMITDDPDLYRFYDGPETPFDPEAEQRYIEQIVKTTTS